MTLSFSEQQNALFRLFAKWHSSTDRDEECKRLCHIDTNHVEEYKLILKKDLLDKLSASDKNLVVNMLELIVAGKNKYTIKEHFERMLVAAHIPLDEKCFASEVLKLLNQR